MSNSAKQQVQTVGQAMKAVDAKKGVKPEPTLADALNTLKGFKARETKHGNLLGKFKLTTDPKLATVLHYMPPQAQRLVQAMAEYLGDDGVVTIEDEVTVSIIAEKLIHDSESNDVIGTYLGLILGKVWGKGRGSDKLRKAMGGNNFAVFTRI
tara:strand:- start:82 stop:540 length:459 start_codon:yes stop_codon:yes gene_type:complete